LFHIVQHSGVFSEADIDLVLTEVAEEQKLSDRLSERHRDPLPVRPTVSDPREDVMVAMTARQTPDTLPARLRAGTASMVMIDSEPLRLAG